MLGLTHIALADVDLECNELAFLPASCERADCLEPWDPRSELDFRFQRQRTDESSVCAPVDFTFGVSPSR